MLILAVLIFTSLVLTAITCVLLAKLPTEAPRPNAERGERVAPPAVVETEFFTELESAPQPPPRVRSVPIEVVLSQLESHVRLEHAAAQRFLDLPTATSLHGRTTSPLVN